MCTRIVDIIPHDQEIVHIAHALDDVQLVGELVLQLLPVFGITLLQAVVAELFQIFQRCVAVRHIIARQLGIAKLDLHMTAVGDLLGIFERLQRIRKQLPHLRLTLDVILSAVIAHPVLICELCRRLDTQQNIVCLRIRRIRVMAVVRRDQLNPRIL